MPQTHIIEIQTAEDMDTKYLVDVLMWGLEQHDSAVDEGIPSWTIRDGDEEPDHEISPLSMTILSED